MLRSAASKTMSVGRFASAVFGLALVLALVFGAASMALAANGQPFLLGKATNAATALTKLTANVNGSAMQVQNTNAGSDDTALNLTVQPGEAPMRVNSDARVANLNSDKIDGKDSAAFLGVNGKARDASSADFADFAGEAQNAQVAADANNLDGKDSAAFFSGETYETFETIEGPGGGAQTPLDGAGCDNRDKVLSGGHNIFEQFPEEDVIMESRALGDSAWVVRIKDRGPANDFNVFALCADFPPLR